MKIKLANQEKFYQALERVFVGAKLDGRGGFVNLLNIKATHFAHIRQQLERDIDEMAGYGTAKSEDIYEKLYSFFSRYFSPNGSVYFTDTAPHRNVYAKIYQEPKQPGLRTPQSLPNEGYEKICAAEEDMALFWKTQNLYYVKSDNLYQSIRLEFNSLKFHFDASQLQHKGANQKKELIFSLTGVEDGEIIKISVSHQNGNTATDVPGMLRKLTKQHKLILSEEDLHKAFWAFKQQARCDFFINKDAKGFLTEQFKIWCANYLWENSNEWSAERVNEIQNLKQAALKLIACFAQFEDELLRIWHKPKFARNANYVVTLDRLPPPLVKQVKSATGYKAQLQEWRELGIDESNPTAPLDTKFFKELELEILAQFDDLDAALDGRLIKSENYQALNTILPKFKGKVQCIYIDPPFNLGSGGDFDYEVNYKDASWATLLENRLALARDLLCDQGLIFVRCDINGNWIVRPLLSDIFGADNFMNEIMVNRTQEFFKSPSEAQRKLMNDTDSLLAAAKSDEARIKLIRLKRQYRDDNDGWYEPFLPSPGTEEDLRIIDGREIYAPTGRKWGLKQEQADHLFAAGYIKMENGKVKYRPEYRHIKNNWTDIPGYTRSNGFKTENSEELLARTINASTNPGELVLDFFLGSGTTAAAAHKLGRKWLGVEMAEHFDKIILPRMKKVLANHRSGISKDLPDYKGGGFFKYYELEQYEETLAKCQLAGGQDFVTHTDKSDYEQYVFFANKKLSASVAVNLKSKKYQVDLSKLYDKIDIAETLANLRGSPIKSIGKAKIEFADGYIINPNKLDYKDIRKLIWWDDADHTPS